MPDDGGWLHALEARAPDVVAAYRGVEEGRFLTVRREVRRRAGEGTTGSIVAQLAVAAEALAAVVAYLPERALRMPGGEEDWNVAQAVGHDVDARTGLVLAAALAARGRWPRDARPVVPGVPGAPSATRETLLARIARSERMIERAARPIAGHETDDCPLEHPLVGQLRCGEWLLFAGVHDLMHLEQLHAIASRVAARAGPGSAAAR